MFVCPRTCRFTAAPIRAPIQAHPSGHPSPKTSRVSHPVSTKEIESEVVAASPLHGAAVTVHADDAIGLGGILVLEQAGDLLDGGQPSQKPPLAVAVKVLTNEGCEKGGWMGLVWDHAFTTNTLFVASQLPVSDKQHRKLHGSQT